MADPPRLLGEACSVQLRARAAWLLPVVAYTTSTGFPGFSARMSMPNRSCRILAYWFQLGSHANHSRTIQPCAADVHATSHSTGAIISIISPGGTRPITSRVPGAIKFSGGPVRCPRDGSIMRAELFDANSYDQGGFKFFEVGGCANQWLALKLD